MDHPFIAKTVKYIKGDIYLYYIMEYVRGKELFDIMRDINLLNKPQTQFFGASMLEVLNYLHGQKIIYRDLKPENIMVLENGYIKFFDFGTVKLIRDRCKTFIGTTSYMAPEIFTGNGYSFQVDMWALGVVMYEFVCGQLPFGEDIEDPMEFYNVMIKQSLTFPSFVNDHLFKDLIQKLLIKDPNKRLSQYMKIREHPYFKDFDWEKLISLDLKAPYTFKLHDIIPLNSNMMYLDYLHSLGNIPLYKRKQSVRQVKFNKWLKNF
jgi:cGMP-dependent protein kinase